MDLNKLPRHPLIIVASLLFLVVTGSTCSAADCDEFVSWVAPAKNAYQKTHRIYPVPDWKAMVSFMRKRLASAISNQLDFKFRLRGR